MILAYVTHYEMICSYTLTRDLDRKNIGQDLQNYGQDHKFSSKAFKQKKFINLSRTVMKLYTFKVKLALKWASIKVITF